MTMWFFGSGFETGPDAGDTMDPARGQFEPAVYVTATLEQAKTYAEAMGALGHTPTVWAVEVDDGSVIEPAPAQLLSRRSHDLAYLEAEARGVDAFRWEAEQGEGGVAMLAILRRGVATVGEIVWGGPAEEEGGEEE
jgi:hypothetical protein